MSSTVGISSGSVSFDASLAFEGSGRMEEARVLVRKLGSGPRGFASGSRRRNCFRREDCQLSMLGRKVRRRGA